MKQVLFQHGTLALLVPGLLAGTMSIGELLQHGDTGIGTGAGLDGELIILEGNAYQINGQGCNYTGTTFSDADLPALGAVNQSAEYFLFCKN